MREIQPGQDFGKTYSPVQFAPQRAKVSPSRLCTTFPQLRIHRILARLAIMVFLLARLRATKADHNYATALLV